MKQTKELFARQMTRKEFLQLAGVAFLTVIGVTNFISTLRTQNDKVAARDSRHGFGSRKFGA